MRDKTRPWKKALRTGLLLPVLAVLIAALWLHTAGAAPEKVGPAVGYKAPAFTLADLDGKPVSLDKVAARNKLTLINFWGIWCPYCVREIPEFVAFYSQYRGRGVEILGVDAGDAPGDIPPFVKKQQMTYPVLIDKNQAVSSLYRISGFPTTFFVDRRGAIKDMIIGATDRAALQKRAAALLAEP